MEGTTTPSSAASDPRIMGCDNTQHASVFGAANQAGSLHITSGCSLGSFLDNAGKEHIRIIEQPLPDGLCGAWHDASRTIWLHDCLNQRQRRCTLCHELIHARHHDPGCGSYRALYPFGFLIKNDPGHPHTASAGVKNMWEEAP